MQRLTAVFVLWLGLLIPATTFACGSSDGWMQSACSRIDQIWNTGTNDLYITGWAWHNRAMYPREKIEEYNETAWGGGFGRSIYDEDGDWQGLYAMAFADSHSNVQPVAGYGFLKMDHITPNWRAGAGFTAFLTQRRRMMNGIPFPAALPLVGVGYRNAMLFATYIPGGWGAGNVLFVFGKLSF